jgi:hypothetical protein
MPNFKFFKLINIIEAAAVTVLLTYSLLNNQSSTATTSSLLIVLFGIGFASLANCMYNLYLVSLNNYQRFLQRTGRIFFWISYLFFSLTMAFFCALMSQTLIKMYHFNGSIKVTPNLIILTFLMALISLTSVFIVFRQPYFFYIIRKNYRVANEMNVDSIGSEL